MKNKIRLNNRVLEIHNDQITEINHDDLQKLIAQAKVIADYDATRKLEFLFGKPVKKSQKKK
jgi:hypothetical protein